MPIADYALDLRDYVLAPTRWEAPQWETAGAVAASVAAAYGLDPRVRQAIGTRRVTPDGDPHSLRDMAPLALLTLGTAGAGLAGHDAALRSTAGGMVEAVALGSAASFALKLAAGRTRPDETLHHGDFGAGGSSFPSGHVTAMFAAAQVFADSRPPGEWSWRGLAYGFGGLTAYARIHGNMHWFSDTVAAAALGTTTGRFVSNRSGEASSRHSAYAFSVQPLDHGAMLSFSIDPWSP